VVEGEEHNGEARGGASRGGRKWEENLRREETRTGKCARVRLRAALCKIATYTQMDCGLIP
jgi:hypothetical protein